MSEVSEPELFGIATPHGTPSTKRFNLVSYGFIKVMDFIYCFFIQTATKELGTGTGLTGTVGDEVEGAGPSFVFLKPLPQKTFDTMVKHMSFASLIQI